MRATRAIAIAIIAASMGVGYVQAQPLSSGPVPAEFPPESFKGRQYVDSNGCVFIRAGIDGNITWVPRVSRDRKVICGFQPSIATKAPARQPAVKVTKPKKAAAPVAAKPKPVKKIARKATAAPKPVTMAPKPVAVAAKPVATAARPITVVKNPAKRVKKPDVKRVAPKIVYENQIASQQGIFVPKGYKPAWEDDRLNPKRTHQTLAGKAQMDAVWTRTIPRNLIVRETGRDVSGKHAGLQHPYTSVAEQPAAGVTVSTQGHVMAAPVRVVRGHKNVKVAAKATAAPKVAVSTHSAMPTKAAAAASHRYVRAGVFASPTHAQKAAQRIANSGLPARMGTVESKGKTYTTVLSGPFRTQAQLTAALGKVRGFGFRNATLRK